MADVKVTREHREAATTALMLGVSDALFAFEFAGETCGDERLEEAARVAQAIADAEARAEQRGSEAERADVIAECERTERTSSVDNAHAVEALRVRIQRGEHVHKAPGGEKG